MGYALNGRKVLITGGPPRHSADSVARAIVKAARSGRRSMILSAEGTFLHYASRHMPAILDRILAKVLVP